MKGRIGYLLVIAGALAGVMGVLSFIPFILTSTLGALALGIGLFSFTGVYSGCVWGLKVKLTGSAFLMNVISAICLVIGGFSLIRLVLGAIAGIGGGNIPELLINLGAFIACFFIGGAIAKIVMSKINAKSSANIVFETIPLFQEIDANMTDASYFVVSFEGVALYSSTNYCYAVYLYEDYQLGALTTVNEVALVGGYFWQKYIDRYSLKIDSEVIPGEPGQTVVAVGTGGIAVGRTSGTPSQYVFKSYIFTRKQVVKTETNCNVTNINSKKCCTHCGTNLTPDSLFCTNCGKKLD